MLWKLIMILILSLAAALTLSSCTCDGKSIDDDTNDDTNGDNDTDDDDTDDDTEEWNIYTIDSFTEGTSITLDSSNNVHISYSYPTALSYSTNKSGSWQIFLIDSIRVGMYSSIAIDIGDKIHISYYDKDNSAIKYATSKSGSWQMFTAADVGTGGPNTTGYNSLAFDSNDKIHIAYHYCGLDEASGCSDDDLKYVTNNSKTGTWQVFTIDTQGETGFHPSIAVDQSGKVHIAYFCGYCPSSCLKYATNLSGSWQIFEVECSTSFGGTGTSITLDSNGKVHISYQDSYSLKYATNASGSWQTLILDASGENVGAYNSIAIDSKSKVHISYLFVGDDVDGASWALKYATNRADNWETFVIDSEEWTGSYTSIGIDSNDYVHISYQGKEESLKYATNRPPE